MITNGRSGPITSGCSSGASRSAIALRSSVARIGVVAGAFPARLAGRRAGARSRRRRRRRSAARSRVPRAPRRRACGARRRRRAPPRACRRERPRPAFRRSVHDRVGGASRVRRRRRRAECRGSRPGALLPEEVEQRGYLPESDRPRRRSELEFYRFAVPPRLRRPATANRLRIIGGRFRGRVVRFPAGAGLRPTPDRVRETLVQLAGAGPRGADDARPLRGQRRAVARGAVARRGAGGGGRARSAARPRARRHGAGRSGRRASRRATADAKAWLAGERGAST